MKVSMSSLVDGLVGERARPHLPIEGSFYSCVTGSYIIVFGSLYVSGKHILYIQLSYTHYAHQVANFRKKNIEVLSIMLHLCVKF